MGVSSLNLSGASAPDPFQTEDRHIFAKIKTLRCKAEIDGFVRALREENPADFDHEYVRNAVRLRRMEAE